MNTRYVRLNTYAGIALLAVQVNRCSLTAVAARLCHLTAVNRRSLPISDVPSILRLAYQLQQVGSKAHDLTPCRSHFHEA